jgi:hypothetical protein
MVGLGSGPQRVKRTGRGIALAESVVDWLVWLFREGWDGDGERVRLEAARKRHGGDAAPRRSPRLFFSYPPRETLVT